MATGIVRNVVFTARGNFGHEQTTVAFIVSAKDGSFAYRKLQDYSRAAAFLEMTPEDIDHWAVNKCEMMQRLSHEERGNHESHYMSSVFFGESCPFHDPSRTTEEFADSMRDHILTEPGQITKQLERQRAQAA